MPFRLNNRPIHRSALLLLCLLCLSGCGLSSAEGTIPAPVELASDPQAVEEQTLPTLSLQPILPATPLPSPTRTSQLSPFDDGSWKTDFSKHNVDWNEILSGGPAKDGIPALDTPTFESVKTAATWLTADEPVILLQYKGVARAYPLRILIWHEVINDVVGGEPVLITYCPLCNASVAFQRTVNGIVLEFGVTGKLRNSDLLMYDRQTESWWQQILGEAIVGSMTGIQLDFLPSQMIRFDDFASQFPQGEVLAQPSFDRAYGSNPYPFYDKEENRPFLYNGSINTRLQPMQRVIGVKIRQEAIAYPFTLLAERLVISDSLDGVPLVIFSKAGMRSALDTAEMAKGRKMVSAAVFIRLIDGKPLSFVANDQASGLFTDLETGSTWNLIGQAIEGSLKGKQLEPLIAFDQFWFAWQAFYPETKVYK